MLSRCAGENHPQAPTDLLFGEKGWNKKADHDYQWSNGLYTVKQKLILLGGPTETDLVCHICNQVGPWPRHNLLHFI